MDHHTVVTCTVLGQIRIPDLFLGRNRRHVPNVFLKFVAGLKCRIGSILINWVLSLTRQTTCLWSSNLYSLTYYGKDKRYKLPVHCCGNSYILCLAAKDTFLFLFYRACADFHHANEQDMLLYLKVL